MTQEHQWDMTTAHGTLTIRPAQEGDSDALATLYEANDAWQRARGIEPGKAPYPYAEIIRRRVRQGTIYVAERDGVLVGTIVILWNDPAVWPDERDDDAGYIHGFAVDRAYAGQGIGQDMLRWASGYIAAQGRHRVRLDCNGDNPALRAYYTAAGFIHRGDLQLESHLAARYAKTSEQN